MSWTADSTKIRADQTCWTADGSDKCPRDKGTTCYPIGPGFFIFFQDCKRKSSGGNVPRGTTQISDNRIIEDEEEILLIIQLAVSYKLI